MATVKPRPRMTLSQRIQAATKRYERAKAKHGESSPQARSIELAIGELYLKIAEASDRGVDL